MYSFVAHMATMNGFRNDFLSATINELDPSKYRKILVIASLPRVGDLVNKLCGKAKINRWIEGMDDEFVTLRRVPLETWGGDWESGHFKTPLSEDEILKTSGQLGWENAAFLALSASEEFEKMGSPEEIHARVKQIAEELIEKHGYHLKLTDVNQLE